MKGIIYDPITKEKKIVDIDERDLPTNESYVSEPTLEERLKATEEALLTLMEMGMI